MAAGVWYNAANIKVGQAVMSVQPYLVATPPVMPVDANPVFDAHLAPWVTSGATEDGFRFTMGKTTQEHTIEEQSTPAIVAITARTARIQCTLSEDTLEAMALAWGTGTITAVAAKKTMVLDENVQVVAALLEMANKQGKARRIMIPQMVASGDVETAFRRAAAKRTYPLNLVAICAPSAIQIVDMIT